MAKTITDGERIRFTFRIPKELLDKVYKQAEFTLRSANEECVHLIAESLGYRTGDSCIVVGDNGKYWFSPVGVYGELTELVVKRFLKGSLPINGMRWDDVFDSYDEAMESFGCTIARITTGGMIIEDWKEFCKVLSEYNIQME